MLNIARSKILSRIILRRSDNFSSVDSNGAKNIMFIAKKISKQLILDAWSIFNYQLASNQIFINSLVNRTATLGYSSFIHLGDQPRSAA
jgi:hypothetical protein